MIRVWVFRMWRVHSETSGERKGSAAAERRTCKDKTTIKKKKRQNSVIISCLFHVYRRLKKRFEDVKFAASIVHEYACRHCVCVSVRSRTISNVPVLIYVSWISSGWSQVCGRHLCGGWPSDEPPSCGECCSPTGSCFHVCLFTLKQLCLGVLARGSLFVWGR